MCQIDNFNGRTVHIVSQKQNFKVGALNVFEGSCFCDRCTAVGFEVYMQTLHDLNPRLMFNAVVFFGLFSIVPLCERSDEIQFCYRRAFYPAFCKSPCSSAYLFTLIAVRGAVSWRYYFNRYALRLAYAFTSDCLEESFQIFTALIICRLHAA